MFSFSVVNLGKVLLLPQLPRARTDCPKKVLPDVNEIAGLRLTVMKKLVTLSQIRDVWAKLGDRFIADYVKYKMKWAKEANRVDQDGEKIGSTIMMDFTSSRVALFSEWHPILTSDTVVKHLTSDDDFHQHQAREKNLRRLQQFQTGACVDCDSDSDDGGW